MAGNLGACRDDEFGPTVRGCRGDFDFTQKFEHVFLAIIPSSVFLALALARAALLVQHSAVVRGALFKYVKLAVLLARCVTLFALLIIVAKDTTQAAHDLSIAAAALSFVVSLSLIPLSYLEHERCRRPSALIGGYTFLILLFDIVQTRTLWLIGNTSSNDTSASLLTASVALNAAVLCLESAPKTRWINWESKDHSPEESSGIFSLGVYFWLNKLLFSGYSRVLSVDDLYPLDENIKSNSLYSQFTAKARFDTYSQDPNWALFKDVCRTLVAPLLSPVAPRIAQIGFTFCQPFFLNTMLTYLSTPETSQSANLGYGLIGASAIIFPGIAISGAFYDYYSQRFMYMVRGLLASAVYNKTTAMKITSLDDSSSAITLMSTDIERIMRGVEAIHELWANLVEVAIACWLLQRRIGTAFLAPIVSVLCCVGALFFVLRLVRKRQSNWMNRIQTRVGTTANAIASMKLYKMSGMAKPVANLIQGLRVDEISVGSKYRVLQIVAILIGNTPLAVSPVLTFALTSSTLNVNNLLTSVSYLMLLQPLTPLFQRLPMMLTALTCLRRIQKFLAADPRADFRLFPYDYAPQSPAEKVAPVQTLTIEPAEKIAGPNDAAFTIEQSSFGWAGEKMVLSDISATIPSHKLTLVVGPVASGKSTFCKVLLGEVPVYQGKVTAHFLRSQIGYCEQNPFLYNETLRNNITGPYIFNQEKYDRVVDATLLAEDFAQLSSGDLTKVGSNGITLSGGQKQRVSIARALYAEPPVLIFDDVLSGLDKTTETQVFNRVFGPTGCLTKRRATAIVCTHSVRHLPVADHIVAIGEDGRIVEEGRFEDLVKNGKYIHSLGVTSGSGTESSSDSDSEVDGGDKDAAPMLRSGLAREEKIEKAMDDRSRQTGDWSIYSHYVKSTSKLATVGLILGGLIVGFCNSFTNVWLKFWAENTFGRPIAFYLGIYALINGAMLLALLVNTGSALLGMITVSGSVLHHRAITTVVTAPLKFFTVTDAGVITNLFSQDMTLIDSELAMALINVTLEGSTSLGMLCVIAAVSPYLAIGYPLILGLVYTLQKFYLRTSRQMRLLDLEAKSPLYTHFADTVKGIATIRAFDWTHTELELNYKLLDTSQRPAYLLAMIQKWLTAVLQLMVAVLAIVVVSMATQLRTNAGLTGASLLTLVTFGYSISWLIVNYTTLETSLGAVSRLRTFSNMVESEDQPDEDTKPPSDWPRCGRIDIKNISASYNTDVGSASPSKLVLKDLNLTILPGEKLAICGRTGSGKSSLMLLLLKLLDPLPSSEGAIEIDGVPFSRVDRATLRDRVIAIPQDAAFLPDGSTVKANLDPWDAATEEECAAVLETVRLGGFLQDRGSIAAKMNADDLSAGQKQLFSLGRAILRKRMRDKLAGGDSAGILLLDEVSSSVDIATERTMLEFIRAEFARYTIVMVSHRLEMVLDFFDSVAVLERGTVIETGKPTELVESPDTRFGELWRMGRNM